MTSRLASTNPALFDALTKASPTLQRKAALLACQIAAARAGLESGIAIVPEFKRRQIAARLDEEYLATPDERKKEKLLLFSKARAAAALVFALDSDQMDEAIYEAIAAVDDQMELIGPVSAMLQQ